MNENQNQNQNQNIEIPGKNAATASMVLGIISVVCWFFGYSSILSIILGIIGLKQAAKAKALGYMGDMRTAGFVLSIIGIIGGAIVFLIFSLIIGAFGLIALFD